MSPDCTWVQPSLKNISLKIYFGTQQMPFVISELKKHFQLTSCVVLILSNYVWSILRAFFHLRIQIFSIDNAYSRTWCIAQNIRAEYFDGVINESVESVCKLYENFHNKVIELGIPKLGVEVVHEAYLQPTLHLTQNRAKSMIFVTLHGPDLLLNDRCNF